MNGVLILIPALMLAQNAAKITSEIKSAPLKKGKSAIAAEENAKEKVSKNHQKENFLV